MSRVSRTGKTASTQGTRGRHRRTGGRHFGSVAACALGLALATVATVPAARAQPALDAASFAATIQDRLARARYMEGTCEPVTLADWADLETRRCTYEVTDRQTGVRKQGLVVMLNPSALQLSRWILGACARVRPAEPARDCARRVFSRVISQSGGQFPIAGVVYEDILPEDGVMEAYGFRHGVTVILEGLNHRATAPLSGQQLADSLQARAKATASQAGPARIVGTTRAQYLKAFPGAQVAGLSWLAVVAEEHKAAMRSDQHRLIDAWLKSVP